MWTIHGTRKKCAIPLPLEGKSLNETILFLIPFLVQVESGGDWQAVGDGGLALGGLQIHAACWQDGTEYLGVDWGYRTGAHDPEQAQAVCAAYLTRYGAAYQRKTGEEPTTEVLSRIWNGGPRGYEKKATAPYWEKVRKAIEAAEKEAKDD